MLLKVTKKIVFVKHYNLGGSHYAYTESLSDAQFEGDRHFNPSAALCVLEMDGAYGKVRTLIKDDKGVIRDPDVSFDAKHILFSWKKSDRKDDYHLYEMNLADGKIRQLTDGLGHADYEEAAAWSDGAKATYRHFQKKRDDMEALERENIRAMLRLRNVLSATRKIDGETYEYKPPAKQPTVPKK